jgi:DNA-binding transcriptional LysR family regulator
VLPVVVEFLSMFPRVTARLFLIDRTVDLIEEGLDVSVRIGALPDSSLIATRVGSIRYITCASPTYLARRGKPSLPQELTNHDCIAFTALSPVERWSFARPEGSLRLILEKFEPEERLAAGQG